MSIVFLFLGCFMLYGKSKYFPEHLNTIGEKIKEKKQIANIIGYLFLLFSYLTLGAKFGLGTGFVIFLISISFVYSLLLIVLPIHKKYVYVIALINVLLIILEINL